MVASFIGQKRSSLQNELVFSPKVCDDQKKKGLCLPISGFSVSKEKKQKQMVSHQNGDTRGGPPPHPTPTPYPLATPLLLIFHSTTSSQKKFPILKFFDYVIACSLWFGSSPQSKILAKPTLLHFNHIAVSTF